jgi:hypothetical protein
MKIILNNIDKMIEFDFGMSTLNKITMKSGEIIYISYINSISSGIMHCEQCDDCIYLQNRKIQAN